VVFPDSTTMTICPMRPASTLASLAASSGGESKTMIRSL
jgi:hypothetical protein